MLDSRLYKENGSFAALWSTQSKAPVLLCVLACTVLAKPGAELLIQVSKGPVLFRHRLPLCFHYVTSFIV